MRFFIKSCFCLVLILLVSNFLDNNQVQEKESINNKGFVLDGYAGYCYYNIQTTYSNLLKKMGLGEQDDTNSENLDFKFQETINIPDKIYNIIDAQVNIYIKNITGYTLNEMITTIENFEH